ncbi:CUE domain-containing protein [Favolaschia claudopus]|uniref:CUE domain-containing protein n=1 Tax=Favolaschia claudopus TaxID=2862362 RepID=A0AAW0BM06_9AGAR
MSYKTAIGASAPAATDNTKYRPQARQLQELFPSWSSDGQPISLLPFRRASYGAQTFSPLLHEVSGDVELAATRISEGHAEQWGAVTRKKDKKLHGPTHTHASKDSFSSSRGMRGGARGGRGGGSARGGGAPRARGSGIRSAAPPHANGHASAAPTVREQSPSVNAWAEGPPAVDNKPVGVEAANNNNTWTNDSPDPAASSTSNWGDSATDTPTASATPSTWAGTTSTATSTWDGNNSDVNGSTSSLPSKAASKTPATSGSRGLRLHEKPAPPPAPAVSAPPPHPHPPATTATAPEPEPQESGGGGGGWEEPTTAQSPSWDEEAPIIKPTPTSTSTSAADVWASASAGQEPLQEEEEPQPGPPVEEPPIPEPVAPEAEPELPEPPAAAPAVPSPSIKPASAARPAAVSHRNSARYKALDQPVTMPSSFGFGSLSLGGDNSSFDNSRTSNRNPNYLQSFQLPPHYNNNNITSPPPASVRRVLRHWPAPQNVVAPHVLNSSVSQPVVSQAPKVIPLAEALASQPAPAVPELTPQQQAYMQQQLAGYPPHLGQQQQQQHQQHLPQQQQQQQQSHSQQQQHQYAQHGLPTHIDPSTHQQVQQQQQATPSHSSYYSRGAASSPYFQGHTPTPPAQAQSQQETPYGAFGGQLAGQGQGQGGHGHQHQHQHQQSAHLSGGFGQQDYGHADGQRGFYESYQQSAFGGRGVGVLGHEDVKGAQQQQQPNSQPSANQGANQQQQQPPPAAGPQGQQGYPPPLPYHYYPYPGNQYYGAPYNSGYSVAPPFVKYPAMFTAGPPGPGSSPGPGQQGSLVGVKGGVQGQGQVGGQGQGGVQGGGYGAAQGCISRAGMRSMRSRGRDMWGHQHQSLGLGQGGGAEYGKLYGGGGQGFMGLGAQGGAGGVGGQQAGGGGQGGRSPESAYKPYGGKDVGVQPRGGGQQQPGQGQGGQGQGQQPQGQGFYGGNRFGGSGGSVGGAGGVGGPQQGVGAHHQQGPQGHLGYSPAQNEFYPYRGAQQQYWQ